MIVTVGCESRKLVMQPCDPIGCWVRSSRDGWTRPLLLGGGEGGEVGEPKKRLAPPLPVVPYRSRGKREASAGLGSLEKPGPRRSVRGFFVPRDPLRRSRGKTWLSVGASIPQGLGLEGVSRWARWRS